MCLPGDAALDLSLTCLCQVLPENVLLFLLQLLDIWEGSNANILFLLKL